MLVVVAKVPLQCVVGGKVGRHSKRAWWEREARNRKDQERSEKTRQSKLLSGRIIANGKVTNIFPTP